jgi:hypothetical protein
MTAARADSPELVTIGRLAEIAGVSRQAAHGWVVRGLIRPALTVAGPHGRSIALFDAAELPDSLRPR